jgi:hypothetical protein
MAETIKSFVYKAHRDGLDAMETWRAAQSLFPHKCVSWGYVVRLRKLFAEGDQVAKAFAELISKSRQNR